MSGAGSVRSETVERVALVTLDRPDKRNAMSGTMWRELERHVAAIAADDEVMAVVVRGAGGAFSAGGDLRELREHGAEHAEAYRRHAEDVVRALAAVGVPTIAVVEGACFGAGCSIALACDIRIATPAARFGIPALRNGLVYEPEFVRRLARIVGQGPAGLLLYGGETWTAATAERHGLVDRCVDDPEVALGDLLGALRSAAPAAIRSTTTAIRSA